MSGYKLTVRAGLTTLLAAVLVPVATSRRVGCLRILVTEMAYRQSGQAPLSSKDR